MLSWPPTNHFANGGLDQSSTVSHGLLQDRRWAWASQNPSRSALASCYAAAVTLACAARSAGGSNLRSSRSRFASVSLISALQIDGVCDPCVSRHALRRSGAAVAGFVIAV